MIAKFKSALAKSTVIELFWLYLVILIPTIAFKVQYLNRLVVGGIPVLSAEALPNGHPVLFFGWDILEVLILVLPVYLLAKLLLKNKSHYLTVCAVIVCFSVQIANWISIKELATLVTPNSMAVSISWVIDNPEHLSSYIRGRRDIVFFLIGAAGVLMWSILPWLLPLQICSRKALSGWHSYLVLVSVVVLLPISLVSTSVAASFSETAPVPFRGYWSSTAVSLFISPDTNLLSLTIPPRGELEDAYQRLVYPTGRSTNPDFVRDIIRDRIKERHILILSLETAPAKYYPIINNPDFPTFFEMSQHAIVSENHFANSPFTTKASFAMLSGIYPNPAGHIAKYGDFQTDGLATILARHGYETVFIDSYKIDWIKGMKIHEKLWRDLGFENLLENAGDEDIEILDHNYDRKLKGEEKSFQKAIDAILMAEQKGNKAVVFIDTIFGHYKWLAKPGEEHLSGNQRVLGIATQFDALMGNALSLIRENDIDQDIIIVVTGDHGLRYQNEFDSLEENMADTEIAFNVPFLLYAPGLIDKQISLPHITSHVDLTPTLLNLVGIESEFLYHHGENMLDQELRHRVTFMMNTRLSSVDRFYWNGLIVSYNNLTGEMNISDAPASGSLPVGTSENDIQGYIRKTFPDIGKIFDTANHHFNLSAGYALQRGNTDSGLAKHDIAGVPSDAR